MKLAFLLAALASTVAAAELRLIDAIKDQNSKAALALIASHADDVNTALPDAIDLFTRTMRAGHNIHSGLETIANETNDPVKMEFKKLMEELALGSQVEPALHGLGKRVPLIDLKFFITSLILQRQTGANMVAVLESLAMLVRERLNMAEKLKAPMFEEGFEKITVVRVKSAG